MEVDMPRWLKVIRGMIGTGSTFAAGVGGVASLVGVLMWVGDRITGRELMEIAGIFSVVAFLLGIAFSGVLAVTARGRQLEKLSLRLVGALGAGAGLLYFVFLALNGGLTLMGAGSAAATLMIARRAGSALESGDELHGLGAGDQEIVHGRSSKVEVPRP
jgi:hypothetical protein